MAFTLSNARQFYSSMGNTFGQERVKIVVKILLAALTLPLTPLAFVSSLALNSTDLAGFVCLLFTVEMLL